MSHLKSIITSISKYFLVGVLAVVPFVVILQIVIFVQRLLFSMFVGVYGYVDNYLYTLVFFTISFALFASIGYSLVKRRSSLVIGMFERIVERIPIIKTVYRVTKKIMNMFSGHEDDSQREVVYIEYPKEGLWVPAYVTNRKDDMYIVYVPTSPNPTSGFTVIVHESKVVQSSLDMEEVTSFIVSVGVDFPHKAAEVSLIQN